MKNSQHLMAAYAGSGRRSREIAAGEADALFIVPRLLVGGQDELRESNDVVLADLNHNLGQRGTVNA